MAVISSTVDMLFNAQDHASRVIGNVNNSLNSQLTTFVQMGQKIPLVGRQISAAMVVATGATERYVRELTEVKKHTDLSTKSALIYQHAIEQAGSRYDTLVRFIDKVRSAQEKSYKIESQMLILRLKRYNVLDKEKGIMTDHNEILKKSAEFLMKYKEGYDRLEMSQKLFGEGGKALLPILEKMHEAQRLVNERGVDFQELMDLSAEQVKENRVVLSELTMAFKDFGVRVATVVLPVLTVLAEMVKLLINVLIFLTKPLFAVMRVMATTIVKVKELIAVFGILAKIVLWIATFVLMFYLRKWALVAVAHLAAAVSSGKLGVQLKFLGSTIGWVGKSIVNMTFWVQTLIADTYKLIIAKGGLAAAMKIVGINALALAGKFALLAGELIIGTAIILALYELFNKLSWAIAEAQYQFAKLFSSENTAGMKNLRQEINLIQKDIDRWSLEGIWDSMNKGMNDTNESAGKLKRTVGDTFDLTRDMYDSLGDSLERAINMPANVLPPMIERLKANQNTLKAIDDASRATQKLAASSNMGGGAPNLQREGRVKVELKQKIEFGDLGEPIMRTLEGIGIF